MAVHKIKGNKVWIACVCGKRFNVELSSLSFRGGVIALPECPDCQSRDSLFVYDIPDAEVPHIDPDIMKRHGFNKRVLRQMINAGQVDSNLFQGERGKGLLRHALDLDEEGGCEIGIHPAYMTEAEREAERERIRQEKLAEQEAEKTEGE